PVGGPVVPVGEILFGSLVGLGQWGAAKRDPRFPADEHDWPVEPLVPQGRGGGAPRLATSDDHHRPCTGSLSHAGSSPSAFVARSHFAPRRGAAGRFGELGLVQGACTL